MYRGPGIVADGIIVAQRGAQVTAGGCQSPRPGRYRAGTATPAPAYQVSRNWARPRRSGSGFGTESSPCAIQRRVSAGSITSSKPKREAALSALMWS